MGRHAQQWVQWRPAPKDDGEVLVVQFERRLVDRALDVEERDNRFRLDVTEHRDLALDIVIDRILGSTNDNIRCDTNFAELRDTLLGRFAL